MSAPWRIELLGRVRAVRIDAAGDGEVVERFPSRKTAGLLAYLALYLDRPQPRDALIDLFWAESDPAAGRQSLSRALSSLRNLLEPPDLPPGAVLAADRAGVRLAAAAVTTDVAIFDRCFEEAGRSESPADRVALLSRAVEVYDGPLLAGFEEEWARQARGWIAERFFEVAETLAGLLAAQGNTVAALALARRGVEIDPLREDAHRTLIRLLVAEGRPEAARRKYAELARSLSDALDAGPEPETLALLESGAPTTPSGTVKDVTASVSGLADAESLIDRRSPDDAPCSGTRTLLILADGRESASDRSRSRGLLLRRGGREVMASADLVGVAYSRASDGVDALLEAAREASAGTVRAALHTEELPKAEKAAGGAALEGARFLFAAANPGQILLCERTTALVRDRLSPGCTLIDHGLFRMVGGRFPERIWELRTAHAPPGRLRPRAADASSGSLPLPPTRFFGREEERSRLAALLSPPIVPRAPLHTSGSDRPRLITLTGPGGSGKTRLAIEVARRHGELGHGGVWYVPLADLSPGGRVPDAIRRGLGLPASPGRGPLDQAAEFLRTQPGLLVLDNLEHLVDEVAPAIEHLLEASPDLTCLVTSRQALRLDGEQDFPLTPLPLPAEITEVAQDALESLSRCPSVQLLVDRARSVRPEFHLARGNAKAVAELCRRLEGIPLAIELAAGRIGVIAPAQMAAHLAAADREWLVSRRPRATPRHRSLWAALDWSYQLLAEPLQRSFRQLSVFRGGFTLDAAASVCDEPCVLEYLDQLRDCSLVQSDEIDGEVRFRMLETLREYGSACMTAEERTAVAARHAGYFLELAERAEPGLIRAEQKEWIARLARERDNLRAALHRLEECGDPTPGLRMTTALRQFWHVRGELQEGRDWMERMLCLAGADRSVVWARGAAWAAFFAYYLGDEDASRRLADETLRVGRSCRDARSMGLALRLLGRQEMFMDRDDVARGLLQESLALFRQIDEPWEIALCASWLGVLFARASDWNRARELHEESLRIWRGLGDRTGIGTALCSLAGLAFRRKEYRSVRAFCEDALTHARELETVRVMSWATSLIGHAAYRTGDLVVSRESYEETLSIRRRLANKVEIAAALCLIGKVALAEDRMTEAGADYMDALRWSRDAGADRVTTSCLEGLAAVAARGGNVGGAARLFGATDGARERLKMEAWDEELVDDRPWRALARRSLGDAAFDAACADGRSLSLQSAAAEAVGAVSLARTLMGARARDAT